MGKNKNAHWGASSGKMKKKAGEKGTKQKNSKEQEKKEEEEIIQEAMKQAAKMKKNFVTSLKYDAT